MLTRRQAAVLDAIAALTAEWGYPPTVRELAERTRLSPARVQQHLDRLTEARRISRRNGRPRTIRMVAPP